VDQMAGIPFTDHPFVATIPAERATWDAEQTRLAGAADPEAWRRAAKSWDELGCPHRAGYASALSFTSARRPPACTSAASSANSASPAGCKRPA
jgi:hypothetical protein